MAAAQKMRAMRLLMAMITVTGTQFMLNLDKNQVVNIACYAHFILAILEIIQAIKLENVDKMHHHK